ncbi:hypothetical protein V5N11_002944 [Cardamine amara subsp. amara]|uniref:Reverse transcriptase zinc-binding domain-containing protein n=1 Tax=Cardamine amara subsp. amara TaxID=228776 RepID=A0ABD0ZVN5_CARAN
MRTTSYTKRDKVSWARTIWFAQGVHRFAFIMWLTVKNRLSTWDKMRSWGREQNCTLCGTGTRTNTRTFFEVGSP